MLDNLDWGRMGGWGEWDGREGMERGGCMDVYTNIIMSPLTNYNTLNTPQYYHRW